MKKLVLILGIAAVLIVGGCKKDDKTEIQEIQEVVDTIGTITIPTGETELVEVKLTELQTEAISANFNTSDNYIDAIIASEDVLSGNSQSMKKVIEAVKLFQVVEADMNKMGKPVLSMKDLKDIKGAVRRITREMTEVTVMEDSEMSIADYQAEIKDEIMPRLDKAITLLEEAVDVNETVVLMSADENGVNVKIEPAHILLVEAMMKSTRGYLNYMLAYDFEMTNVETTEYNKDFLTVANREYIKKSKQDITEGVEEFINAINAMPESDMMIFDKENYTVTLNPNVEFESVENVLSIPSSLKKEAVTVLAQIKNALNGAATITVNGFSIKLNLSVFFKDSFELVDIVRKMVEMLPADENTIDTWDDTALANYTLEGILPDGAKNLAEKVGEGSWEYFVNVCMKKKWTMGIILK